MPTVWQQHYDPLGQVVFSTLVAMLPIAFLLSSIALWRVRIHFAALLALGLALVIAVAVYRMPFEAAVAAAVFGASYGLFPIGWIILNLIFLYQLTVQKGTFAILRSSLATLAPDARIQVILIAFSFGAFFEGAAGFGTPVAITSAILIRLGFQPLAASGLSLIANTAPVAFGALGAPLLALSGVTGIDALKLSAMVGRQLPIFSYLIPFWVVWASNVLFGNLQTITARQVGVNPVLMAAANSSGGVMGKMLDAQSIVVASTATDCYGHEGKILRFVFWHSLALAVLVGLVVLLQAHVAWFKLG